MRGIGSKEVSGMQWMAGVWRLVPWGASQQHQRNGNPDNGAGQRFVRYSSSAPSRHLLNYFEYIKNYSRDVLSLSNIPSFSSVLWLLII